jgi:hypothetical protein
VEVRSLRAPHSMSMARWIYILRGGPLRARRRADFGGAPHTSGPPRAMRRGGANNNKRRGKCWAAALSVRCAMCSRGRRAGEAVTHLASSHHNHQQRMMATPSYKERMAAARAQPAQREAEWHRRIELSVEVCRMAMAATKAALRAGGDKLSRSAHARTERRAGATIRHF